MRQHRQQEPEEMTKRCTGAEAFVNMAGSLAGSIRGGKSHPMMRNPIGSVTSHLQSPETAPRPHRRWCRSPCRFTP